MSLVHLSEYIFCTPGWVGKMFGSPGRFGCLLCHCWTGDTHGQLEDVLHMFHRYGPPARDKAYLFNGDVSDRGPEAGELFSLGQVEIRSMVRIFLELDG